MQYHWQVKVPEAGPINRTHLWVGLKRAVARVRVLLGNTEGVAWPPSEDAVISEDEERAIRSASHRLDQAADQLDPNVLDRLAAVVDDEAIDKAERANLPVNVHRLVDDYYSDVYTFLTRHDEDENLVFAFAVLQAAVGFDDEDMGEAISKVLGRPDRHGDRYCRLWTCPVCEGHQKLYRRENGGKPCKRCCGWGYVFGKEPVEELAALEAAQAKEQEPPYPDGSVDT